MRPARLIAVGLALLMATVASPVAVSGDHELDSSGNVHTVEPQLPVSGPMQAGGTSLKHTMQHPDGTLTTVTVPGTARMSLNLDPVVRIDPVTDEPVLVWSRNVGGGFDLAISRYTAGAWSYPAVLVASQGDARNPMLEIGPRFLHVIWECEADGEQARFRVSADRETFAVAYGPEHLPLLPIEDLIAPGQTMIGDGGAGPDPGLTFFSERFPPRTPGGSGEIHVWGVRDEPVPIGFEAGFELPTDIGSLMSASAGYVGGRFAVWFADADGFYYRTYEDGSWSAFGVILATPDFSTTDAYLEMQEMLERALPQ